MRKTLSLSFIAVLVLFTAQTLFAATVTTDYGVGGNLGRPVTQAEVDNGTDPANGPDPADITYEFLLTADADVLRVGDVFITFDPGPNNLYNNPTGSNTAPPNPAFIAVFPGLGVDSWITTPGTGTATAGGDLGDDNVSWFDTSDDGPVNDFMFARLTTQGRGVFSGVVSVAGTTGPEVFPFSLPFGIPEPTSLALASLGMIGIVVGRRRS